MTQKCIGGLSDILRKADLFSLVLPFHRDADRLLITLKYLHETQFDLPLAEILLCHNGPPLTDSVQSRIKGCLRKNVALLHTDRKGLGAGYKLGIEAASGEFVILSASDLPFGLSDIEAFLNSRKKSHTFPPFAIGSKSHKSSRIEGYGALRRGASVAFWLVRTLFLGRQTPRDSQGSLIVRTRLAKKLIQSSNCDSYFFPVEFITLAQRQGIEVIELPVVLENHDDNSSVSLLKDGFGMARDLVRFWRRLNSEA